MTRNDSLRHLCSLTLLFTCLAVNALSQRRPVAEELKLVSQVPATIPQRITGMAFDGEKLWFSVYMSSGRYATFEPNSSEWTYSSNEDHHRAIRDIAQPFSASSGFAFEGKRLWVGGSYGEGLGSIDLESWQADKLVVGKLRTDLYNSQSYSSLAFDGEFIWAAWHMTEYRLPVSESQQLLKIDRNSGEVLVRYVLPPGTRNDMVHGLTFDGDNLWHVKDCRLSAISLEGKVIAQFVLKELKRPSGLAWDGENLWIVEFDGKLWKLPMIPDRRALRF